MFVIAYIQETEWKVVQLLDHEMHGETQIDLCKQKKKPYTVWLASS